MYSILTRNITGVAEEGTAAVSESDVDLTLYLAVPLGVDLEEPEVAFVVIVTASLQWPPHHHRTITN